MIKRTIALTLIACIAFAAKNNSKLAPENAPAPQLEKMDYLTDAQISDLAENFKSEKKRTPSGTARVATEDLLSPEFVKFRDKIIHAKTGEEFYEILNEYSMDPFYNSIPESANDLKFIVARMATWLPFRGITWRMTPMVHNIVVTQQVLAGMLRNLAEQGINNFPDSHIEAQMLFLTMPYVNKGTNKFAKRFEEEVEFAAFMGTDVYYALKIAAQRIEKIKKMVNVGLKGKGIETPIVFDARIRFGENAFNDNYDAMDRFKVMGEAERFATLARLNRRLSAVSSMLAYNWKDHFKVRKAIGKDFGIGVAESAILGDSGGNNGEEYINGPTRESRTNIVRSFPNTYTLVQNGEAWMKVSYFHLHKSAVYLTKTWDNIKNDDMGYVMQLDPEVFTARREQIEMGINNINKIAGKCAKSPDAKQCDPNVRGNDEILGSLSGEKLAIDLKGFYDNPPRDMKNLLPLTNGFTKNEDLEPLKKLGIYRTMSSVPKKPDVMKIQVGKESTTFRNYLYGRAKEWDSSKNGYGVVFPGVSKTGVAKAMSIINETRGARMLGNTFTAFIR